MELSKVIGENLKEYRKGFGFSQDQVASFIGVDRSTISLYENAEREIPITHLEKLSDLYAVELEDLILKSNKTVARFPPLRNPIVNSVEFTRFKQRAAKL